MAKLTKKMWYKMPFLWSGMNTNTVTQIHLHKELNTTIFL